jgi:hypothetical protein
MTESVKWSTYVDALSSAIRLRSLQRGKKEVEAMLESADADGTDEEDDDELASRLSPYDEAPAPIIAESTEVPSAATTGSGDESISLSPRNQASQLSVNTATTGDNEFYESCVPLSVLSHLSQRC